MSFEGKREKLPAIYLLKVTKRYLIWRLEGKATVKRPKFGNGP